MVRDTQVRTHAQRELVELLVDIKGIDDAGTIQSIIESRLRALDSDKRRPVISKRTACNAILRL
ncbi:hypothetical protein LCGC14_1438280 [marine sediment metagenome]|uniref:Uncharacterized protein n=1 Tax=marine sediment metagenome TaxID=412755 RepID=A0A0F9M1X8_9ZZZZ